MSGPEKMPAGPITVTHARIRLEQGDPVGARRLLEEFLARNPGDPEAQALLLHLPGAGKVRSPEPNEPAPPPPVSATAEELAARFRGNLGGEDSRVARLKTWLHRIEKMRGDDVAE